jgi:hypothetical protein
MGYGLRYFGAAVGFGFAAVWIMASLAAALVCVLAAAVGYGAVFAAERTRTKLAIRAGSPDISTRNALASPSRTPDEEDLPLSADELNHDLGYVYEPTAATPPLAAGAEYGWAPNDDTVTPSETPHSDKSG